MPPGRRCIIRAADLISLLVVRLHRLADELRAEQEMAMLIERDRKLLEAQVFSFNISLLWSYLFNR